MAFLFRRAANPIVLSSPFSYNLLDKDSSTKLIAIRQSDQIDALRKIEVKLLPEPD